jgi:putative phosphoesterase
MKILILSDTHMENGILEDILAYRKECDLIVHCGDTSLPYKTRYKKIDYIVKGNHDYDESYPTFITHDDYLITHGHLYNVYKNYDELIRLCKENNVHYCFHGHTHVPTLQIHEGITFINPGSTMINRGSYGYGTYAIAEIDKKHFSCHFYHHTTHECVDYVLEEGLTLLEEFKKLVAQIEKEKTLRQ